MKCNNILGDRKIYYGVFCATVCEPVHLFKKVNQIYKLNSQNNASLFMD